MKLDDEKNPSTTDAAIHEGDSLAAAPPVVNQAAPDQGAIPAAAAPAPSAEVSPELNAKILELAENAVKQSLFAIQDQIATAVGDYFAAHPIDAAIVAAIDNLKADMIAHLPELLGEISRSASESANVPAIVHHGKPPAETHELAIGDPVRVFADAQHKTFREGEIVAVHDGGHAYDVKLDDGSVSKIGADGLEFDDRK